MCVNTTLACLVMWLMVAPLSWAVWWKPGRVRVPSVGIVIQKWDYIIHTHHTVHKRVLEPGQALTQVTAIVLQYSSTFPEVTLAWPKFYACKMGYSASLG